MKQIFFIALIAIICVAKLVQIQFADIDKHDPNQMYEITLTKNGVAK